MAENKDNTNKIALNRSFSFSGSPVMQKVSIEQSFQNQKGETLTRHYSCEQIYDRRSKQAVQFKQELIVHSPRKQETNLETFPFTSRSSHFNFHKSCPEQEGFQHSLINNKNLKNNVQECTPMEVDTSMDDNSMSDVHSFNISDNDEHEAKISKLILPPIKSETKKRNLLKYLKYLAMVLIPVACALILVKSDIFAKEINDNNDRFQGENITNALKDLVYGQQDVIMKIKEVFSDISDNHLLVFVGGIGVGKTYTANIISNNFPWKNNVVKIISPQHKNIYHESKFVRTLSKNHYNLVIVDNLEIEDNAVIPFVKKILASKRKVIIILIYTISNLLDNIQQKEIVSNSNAISETLLKTDIKHTIITFNKLDIEVIRKCIRYSMAKKGLIINQYNIEHVLQNLNYEYSGCKGVYSKVALLR